MESDAYNEVDSNTWLKGNELGFFLYECSNET